MKIFTPLYVFLLLAISTACGSSTAKNDASKGQNQKSNAAKNTTKNIPNELLGVWDLRGQPCKLPGNPDSDTKIEILPTAINGYEHWYTPKGVEPLSNTPKAWRIQSKMHSDGEESDQTQIFAMSGADTLTVIDDSSPEIYARCK